MTATPFQEVVVIDSNSTDATPEIARTFGAKVINFSWDGKFPKKRNWFLMNEVLACDWVLFLDADEIVDDAFCKAAKQAINDTEHVGFWLNYSNFFLGRELKHGVPQRKLALFKVGAGRYERIEESAWSSLDMEIHEHPILKGSIGEISLQIKHNDFRGLAQFIDRHNNYAQWEASRVKLLKKGGASAMSKLTGRQKFKYENLEKWWFPWFYYLHTYVLKRGFLDGGAGFAYAFYKAWYFYTIRLMISEKKQC